MNSKKNLTDIIDYIYKALETDSDNPVDLSSMDPDEGRIFVATLVNDLRGFKGIVRSNTLYTSKKGWILNIPFPVTVDVFNREQTPGNKVYVKNMNMYLYVVIYYGISPELENFVNIVLWPTNRLSNISNKTYSKIYDMINESKTRQTVLF